MVRRFFRDSAVYAVPAAVSAGTSFITFPLFAHHFPPSSYGILDLLSFASMLVVLVVALEIYQGVGRYVAGETDSTLVRSYASTALWWTVACYAVFAVALLLLARPVSSIVLGARAPASLLRIAVGWTTLGGILALMQAQLRWQMRSRAFAAASVTQAVASTGFALLFVFSAHLGVAGVLWGQLTGNAVALLLVTVLSKGIFGFCFDRSRLTRMLRFSAPLVISNVGVFLNLYADRIVIQHLRSLSDLGLYGVGSRIALLAMLVLTSFQGAAVPLFLSRRTDPATPAAIARIFRLFSAIALMLFLGLSLLASPIVRIVAASAYQPASSAVPFLVVSTLFANMYFFAPGLAIAERTMTMAKLTVAAGVGNVVLAVMLVPPLGIVGAGLATGLTSLGWFIALMRASQMHYRVPHAWRPLTEAALVAVCLVAFCFAALPQSRADALSPAMLAVRLGLFAGGTTVCVILCLGVGESRSLLRRVVQRSFLLFRDSDRLRQPA